MKTIAMAWTALDRAGGDLEGQVYHNLRERILDGRLMAGQCLPSSRSLALSLGVARSTIVHAYERLQAEGFVKAATGSATRVAVLPAPPQKPPPQQPLAQQSLAQQPGRPATEASYMPAGEPQQGGVFQPGVPDLSAFPHAAWARCLAARARALRVHDLGYGDASGLPELKAAILGHVSTRRGVMAAVEQVVIVPSTGAAIDLITRVLLSGKSSSDVAWIEEPGYPAAQRLLRDAGARLVPVPCDANGIDISRIDGPPPRLIYVTPSHQYPTGATMSLPRRLALLDVAQATGAIVLEDDYDSEFHYTAKPIAALQGIDRGHSVAYLGTFSKVLAPGLRVGYAILPSHLVPAVADAMRLRGVAVPIHMQAALADFIGEGRLRAHVGRMTTIYATRTSAITAALDRHCGRFLETGDAAGGLQLAAWFRESDIDDRAVALALNTQGLAVQPLSSFYLGPSRPGLLLGIGRIGMGEIDMAVSMIGRYLGVS